MNSRNHNRKSRRYKSDLIDLSQEIDSQCNTWQHEFDPLNPNHHLQTPKQSDKSIVNNRFSQPLQIRPRSRRNRANSVSLHSDRSVNTCPPIGFHPDIYENAKGANKQTSVRSSVSGNSTHTSRTSDETSQSLCSDNDDRSNITFRNNTVTCGSLTDRQIGFILPPSLELYSHESSRVTSGKNDKLLLLRKFQRSSRELELFTQKLKSFRAQFKHNDEATNPGLVYSPTLYSSKVRDMSVKVIITSPMANEPLSFTCNVSISIEHLISHAVCSMFDKIEDGDNMQNYLLKVSGKDEFFDSKLCLADYALVSHCWKFDLDVELTLIDHKSAKRVYKRTPQDDYTCNSQLSPDDILSRDVVLRYSDLNFEKLGITIATFDREAQRLYRDVTHDISSVQTQKLLQSAKAICSLMVNCETGQLTEAMNNLLELCKSYKREGKAFNHEDRYKMIEVIQHAIRRLTAALRRLLRLVSATLPVDFEVANDEQQTDTEPDVKSSFVDTPLDLVKESVSLRVHVISQLPAHWLATYNDFYLEICLMHGDKRVSPTISSTTIRSDTSFFPRLKFDEEILIPVPFCDLPRETRYIFTLVGIESPPASTTSAAGSGGANSTNIKIGVGQFHAHLSIPETEISSPLRRSVSASSICSTIPMYTSSPRGSFMSSSSASTKPSVAEPVTKIIGAAIVYMLDSQNNVRQGDLLLRIHPFSDTSPVNPNNILMETIADRQDPVMFIELKRFQLEKKVHFPLIPSSDLHEAEGSSADIRAYEELDSGVRFVLDTIRNRQCHEQLAPDEKLLLWDNRYYLTSEPAFLPLVLRSVPDWSAPNLARLYAMIKLWKPLEAIDAMQLLLPSFPDSEVREIAVGWLVSRGDDELYDYLPQLIQALRFERKIDCALFWLLIERALKNVRIANLIYWQLKLMSRDRLALERSETLMHCVLWLCGPLFKAIDKQEELLAMLARLSEEIKKSKDSLRKFVLLGRLEKVQDYLADKKPAVPWAPSLEVCDIDLKSCSYFPSNALPLKLAFRSVERSCRQTVKFYTYNAIFKTGDDLRQDMLTTQMIRIMEKLWLREGLDLKMVTFDCLATDERQGFVEMVQNAETLRKIQQNTSLITGSFNPKAIDSYIRHWNTSELEYKKALDNFLHSCAGYSVATYLLGICDRHNDNIMVTNSGHLFHIDFGKFLGDAQMLGNIKRDRTPFVLSADMAYVINGGDKPSKKFQTYIELCTMAFNITRRNRNLFLNLFSLMSSAGINGLDGDSVRYIDRMLMPELSETEAMSKFTHLIHESLNARSTQMNFLIHNLSQLRWSNTDSKQTLLSFIPKTFRCQDEGKIESLDIVHLYKSYEPEKQYFYVVRVKRVNQPDMTDIHRTFREFSELQMKLNIEFPLQKIHCIDQSGKSLLMDLVGRSNTREVAEKRRYKLEMFLNRMMNSPREIAESDLVYTFFHPILRDQKTNPAELSTNSDLSMSFGVVPEYNDAQRTYLYRGSKGQVKLSITHKANSLTIMVMHAKNLSWPVDSPGPNCYAKTYLFPDPQKQTKRKTRVVSSSCHPTFMELIVYEMISLEEARRMTLRVSLWHSEFVQSKICLGAALIPLEKLDLSKESKSWYPLREY